ncbi:hypothetical protein BGX30_007440 [Mortierella sp. GBA39]|nr:hypothetical protein BGX30_007440 [Mortierella sp. GBA39]
MSALLKTLTFNALQQKSIPSTYCADHELFRHVISKWDIPEEGTFSAAGTCSGIDNCVYLKTSKDDSSPDERVFDGSRGSFRYNRTTSFRKLGSPLCLYRLGCTFPSAVHVENTDKSAWWSDHRQIFGFMDFKGVTLWFRMNEAYLSEYVRKNGDSESAWRVMRGLKEQQSNEVVEEPYSDTLPQELVDRLSAPETGDPALLEELSKFVEDNRFFKEDMVAPLNYLASDQCVHGYCHLVAGYGA